MAQSQAQSQFEQALKKLVEDRQYREAVIKEPSRLTADYKNLQVQELLLLMQVWQATGHPDATSLMITLCHCCCGHN
jgi:hypothetical protein